MYKVKVGLCTYKKHVHNVDGLNRADKHFNYNKRRYGKYNHRLS